jgi:NAD(P)-dependent dehydrogenase (short-subunit alcohol dehydrogenase family)
VRFSGKVAVITGGAGGMGCEAARAFAAEGASVMVGDTDEQGCDSLAGEARATGWRVATMRCDVTVEADVAAMVVAAEARFGRLDTIFNNAGIEQPSTPSIDVSAALFAQVIDVNLKGVFYGCKHAIPALSRAGGGSIVNNCSVAAVANVGGNIAYAASKGAVMAMTRVLAVEYADRNIPVNAINPGVIDTEMNRRNKARAADPEAMEAGWGAITPLGRMGTVQEIAQTVLFLGSPDAGFITEVGLLVDGGRAAT